MEQPKKKKLNKDKILYTVIFIMTITIIVLLDLISVGVIDNSLIISLNVDTPPLTTIKK